MLRNAFARASLNLKPLQVESGERSEEIMTDAGNIGNSRSAVVAIIAIVVAAVAVIAGIIAVAFNESDAVKTPGENTEATVSVEVAANDEASESAEVSAQTPEDGGKRAFSSDSQLESADVNVDSQNADAQPAASQEIVGQWYYDIDPTGSGGAARPMYYALDVLEDGTATLTYNGMSYAKYSWTANGDAFKFVKTGSDSTATYADSAQVRIADDGGLKWSEDGNDMLFVRAK